MNNIITTLQEKDTKKKLKSLGIKHLKLVGSYSTGKEKKSSDIDFVYEKIDPENFSLFERYEVQEFLKKIFKKEIDLISKDAIHPLLKDSLLSHQHVIF